MKQSKGREFYDKYGIYIIVLALIVLLSIITDGFFSWTNFTNVLRTTSVYAIMACGMTFVMISGCIDLSVGSIVALTGCVSAICMVSGIPMLISVIIGIAIGGLCGLVNGICISIFRVPFFITTAGMMYAASGIALVITSETPVNYLPKSFDIFGAKTYGLIPSQAIIAAIFFLICLFLLNHTKFGRYTYAIGSNEKTAILSGIDVKKYRILIYVLNGLAAGLAGIIVASRLKVGSPIVGMGYEIDAIAAAAIGGVSMTGGEGNIKKTIIGAFIICIIRTGLNILGISSSNQKIIIGAILVIVVAIDMLKNRNAE